jgi:hypothetical protein
MVRWIEALRRAGMVVALALVAGCSTLGVPAGPVAVLDPLRDDVGAMVVAFDLPRGLGPAAGSLLTFDVAGGGEGEHLRLALQQADVDALPSGLPPPAIDRAYYLFALAPADRATLQRGQAAALARGASPANATLAVVPKLCSAGPVDAATATLSVFAVVPGRQVLPFINRQTLAAVLQQPGSTQMGPCG